MSEWFYVGAAYGVTWAALGGYAIYLLRRRTRAQGTLARLYGGEQ